jgi:hypothetical protein
MASRVKSGCFWLILSALACAQDRPMQKKNPSVVILPFSVHAAEELNYLSTQIATLLSEHLEREGATTVVLAPEDVLTLPKTTPSAEAIAAIADRYEADRLIWAVSPRSETVSALMPQ